MELESQIKEVLANYLKLTYISATNSFEGELYVSKQDSYDVRIELGEYPLHFPIVYEIGERIPRTIDRHIYSDTGSCCLTTRAKAQVLLKTKITSIDIFIKEIVIPYFQNNSYFEINKEYCSAEYSHNSLGVVEGYRDILQTNNDLQIIKLISHRIKKQKLRMHNFCYCGSGLSLKRCNGGKHYRCYKDFRKIDIEVLKNDLYYFSNHLRLAH